MDPTPAVSIAVHSLGHSSTPLLLTEDSTFLVALSIFRAISKIILYNITLVLSPGRIRFALRVLQRGDPFAHAIPLFVCTMFL